MDSDEQLLLSWISGRCEKALTALCQRWHPFVRKLSVMHLGETLNVDDAAARVLELMAEHAGSIEPGRLKAWLRSTTANVCANFIKSQHRRHSHEAGYGRAPSSIRQSIVEPQRGPSEADVALERAMEQLNEKQRGALVFHHVDGNTIEQTAALLGLTGAEVKWLVQAAKANVRDFFTDNEISFPWLIPPSRPGHSAANGDTNCYGIGSNGQ